MYCRLLIFRASSDYRQVFLKPPFFLQFASRKIQVFPTYFPFYPAFYSQIQHFAMAEASERKEERRKLLDRGLKALRKPGNNSYITYTL